MEVTAAEVRRLVDQPGTGKPVTSVYLNTDGARFPRPTDYEARLDGLLRDVRVAAERLGPSDARSVKADDRISPFRRVRNSPKRPGRQAHRRVPLVT